VDGEDLMTFDIGASGIAVYRAGPWPMFVAHIAFESFSPCSAMATTAGLPLEADAPAGAR
jgi:hypothetical protein